MRYFTLFILLISLNLTAQKDTIPEGVLGVDYNVTDSKGLKQGEWLRVYENGSIYYTGFFKDGQPVGEFHYYYNTGELMTVATHKEGGLTETLNYRTTGTLLTEGNYLNQKKEGVWKMYNEKGHKVGEIIYKNDQQEGEDKVYYASGQLAKKTNYVNGILEGPYEEYFDNGKLKGQGSYSNGKLHGAIVTYQSPGVLLYEGQLKDGVAVGEWNYYMEDGRLELRILYDDSGAEVKRKHENGTVEEYYDSGIPKSYYEYKHGKRHGYFEEFYDKGEFVRTEVLSEDRGMAIEFKEELKFTQIKMEGEYRMGKLHGEVIYYKENGQLDKTETYDQGVLVDTVVHQH